MKKLLFFVTIFQIFVTFSYGQDIKFKLSTGANASGDTIKLNDHGTTLKKGDTLVLYVSANGNGNTTTRQILFDFEYPNNAFTLIGIANTGTAGNGGVLPASSQISESYYQYPGYRFKQTASNITSNGSANYQFANYGFTSGGNHTIIRHNLTWASTTGMPYTNYWGIIKLTFKLNTNAVGLSFDPITMNFAAGFNQNGTLGTTFQEAPLAIPIYLDPNSESYVKAHVDVNPAVTQFTLARVAFTDTLTGSTYLVDANDAGDLAIDQTRFKENTVYKVNLRVNADVVKDIMNAAVTVSDFTAAQAEFTGANLDGTFTGSNIKTGMGYYAADVNKSKTFDGGDLVRIFGQSVGLDTLYVLPSTYRPGTDVYLDVPTFTDSVFNNATASNWNTLGDYVYFKTGVKGSNLPLNLKYITPGDINRSFSSNVVASDGTIKSFSVKAASTPVNTDKVDVNLNTLVVTSNSIEIPISVSYTGELSALQFEFTYDTTKIKFESLASTLPNTWFTFATPKGGKIKFGAIDKGKSPITGAQIPFKVKFSSVDNGVDLATLIRIGSTIDAADSKGNQVGIKLNTTQIKLIGYNNF
jgi:hypothetical protein